MKNKNNSNKRKMNKIETKKQGVLTVAKFEYYFENIKEFIKSTVKGSETVLKDEISELRNGMGKFERRMETVEYAVTEHSKMIKDIKVEVQGVRTELKGEIQGLRTDLKDEMHQMENRLSNKIDKNSVRLDDHEVRISALESTRF